MPIGPPTPFGRGEPNQGFTSGGYPRYIHPSEAEPAEVEPAPAPVAMPEATPDIDATTEDSGTPVTHNPPDPVGDADTSTPSEMFEDFDEDQFKAGLYADPSDDDPFPADEPDDAEEMDYETAKVLFKADTDKLHRIVRRTPSTEYVYVEELNAGVSVKEVSREWEREMAKRAANLVIETQLGGDLLSALESAMEIDHAAILDEVTSDDYDEFDRIVVGHRQRNIKLIGKGHMVRLLAQKKAGKTTAVMELMRCSITGEHAFGAFEIQPIEEDESILFIDPELSPEDYKAYVRSAFSGMSGEQVNRIKRFSTRNQHVGERTDASPVPAVFDLSSESTRDALIKVCNAYNVTRIVFDSYVKLIPGSVNKDDDVKRMLANWLAIQGSTNVRESFWVGHINNSGEVRSSGSMLLDGTFESLLAITIDATGRRFLQAQAGRQVDELDPVEIIINKTLMGHERPYINLDSDVKPVVEEMGPGGRPGAAKAPKAAKESAAAKVVEELESQTELGRIAIVSILYPVGPVATREEGVYLRGGFRKEDLADQVLSSWTTFNRWITPPSKASVVKLVEEMVLDGTLLYAHPVKGVRVYWLSPTGEALYLERHQA